MSLHDVFSREDVIVRSPKENLANWITRLYVFFSKTDDSNRRTLCQKH